MQHIREIQQIARAEDIEFSKLKASTTAVIRNMFVFTADETGIKRFEKLLGITPKAAQSLDDRRLYIISMMNRRKMSLNELTAMLSNYSEGLELLNDVANMEMIIAINTDAGSLATMNSIIDEILPLNIYFEFSLQRETVIKYRMEDLIFMAFEPAAGETEYCNFDNNRSQIEKAGYIQSITGFSYTNDNPIAGQMVCGLECCLAMQAPLETQESVLLIQTDQSSITTPIPPCSEDLTVIGNDPPFELQEDVVLTQTDQSSAITPVLPCGGNMEPIGGDPPHETQESAVMVQDGAREAINQYKVCGTDYAREEE